MGFYTGSVNSYENLKDALIAACVSEGWSASDGIVSRDGLFVRLYHSSTSTSTEGPGLIAAVGNGQSGAALVDPSPCRPRLGRVGSATDNPSFPAQYFIHIHANPAEVYVILQFNVDGHYFLAFGQSDVPGIGGSGNWLGGTTKRGYPGSTNGMVISTADGAGGGFGGNNGFSSGLFWGNYHTSSNLAVNNQAIHQGLDVESWGSNLVSASGLAPIVARQPNAWNGEALLLPIQVFVARPENKRSLVADLKHARYIRVDNYDSGDIITIGPEQWRVYPFYRKNVSQRDGAGFSTITHTGTFGWALRYDPA